MKTFDDFHDGLLDGLLIQDDATVSIFLSTADRQKSVLKVGGVLSLKVDGFRQGNIIYDVIVRTGDELTLDDMVNFYDFKDEKRALTKLEESRQKRLVILEINPSYGATCIILAESVDLLNGHEIKAAEAGNSRA